MELWADIKGFEGIYQVSNLSSIRVLNRVRVINDVRQFYPMKRLKQVKMKNGYLTVTLGKDKELTPMLVHRIVAEVFVPNPHNKTFINHKDGNKQNNLPENLEWCTRSENMIHAFATGLMPKTRVRKIA